MPAVYNRRYYYNYNNISNKESHILNGNTTDLRKLKDKLINKPIVLPQWCLNCSTTLLRREITNYLWKCVYDTRIADRKIFDDYFNKNDSTKTPKNRIKFYNRIIRAYLLHFLEVKELVFRLQEESILGYNILKLSFISPSSYIKKDRKSEIKSYLYEDDKPVKKEYWKEECSGVSDDFMIIADGSCSDNENKAKLGAVSVSISDIALAYNANNRIRNELIDKGKITNLFINAMAENVEVTDYLTKLYNLIGAKLDSLIPDFKQLAKLNLVVRSSESNFNPQIEYSLNAITLANNTIKNYDADIKEKELIMLGDRKEIFKLKNTIQSLNYKIKELNDSNEKCDKENKMINDELKKLKEYERESEINEQNIQFSDLKLQLANHKVIALEEQSKKMEEQMKSLMKKVIDCNKELADKDRKIAGLEADNRLAVEKYDILIEKCQLLSSKTSSLEKLDEKYEEDTNVDCIIDIKLPKIDESKNVKGSDNNNEYNLKDENKNVDLIKRVSNALSVEDNVMIGYFGDKKKIVDEWWPTIIKASNFQLYKFKLKYPLLIDCSDIYNPKLDLKSTSFSDLNCCYFEKDLQLLNKESYLRCIYKELAHIYILHDELSTKMQNYSMGKFEFELTFNWVKQKVKKQQNLGEIPNYDDIEPLFPTINIKDVHLLNYEKLTAFLKCCRVIRLRLEQYIITFNANLLKMQTKEQKVLLLGMYSNFRSVNQMAYDAIACSLINNKKNIDETLTNFKTNRRAISK